MLAATGGKYFFLGIVLLIISFCFTEATKTKEQTAALSISKTNLVKRIFGLLEKLESNSELNASTKFAALLGEFLIKQKVRFFEPTRYEEQIYYELLHKLDRILCKLDNNIKDNKVQKEILDNIFQHNVMLMPPQMRYGQLANFYDYESLAQDYAKLVGNGRPNSSVSDLCLATIATLNVCHLNPECLHIIVTNEPTYGYQRMHQILLLYVLMHHKCAPSLVSTMYTYELVAIRHCSEAYKEQNVIRSWGTPPIYRDLYLEQIAICGLFGYNEFMNWRNILEVNSWQHENECLCIEPEQQESEQKDKRNCNCGNHINNLALVYYINALLLLN